MNPSSADMQGWERAKGICAAKYKRASAVYWSIPSSPEMLLSITQQNHLIIITQAQKCSRAKCAAFLGLKYQRLTIINQSRQEMSPSITLQNHIIITIHEQANCGFKYNGEFIIIAAQKPSRTLAMLHFCARVVIMESFFNLRQWGIFDSSMLAIAVHHKMCQMKFQL